MKSSFEILPFCFVGAGVGTQCLDIAHTLYLVFEEGLDIHSEASVATSDVRRF